MSSAPARRDPSDAVFGLVRNVRSWGALPGRNRRPARASQRGHTARGMRGRLYGSLGCIMPNGAQPSRGRGRFFATGRRRRCGGPRQGRGYRYLGPCPCPTMMCDPTGTSARVDPFPDRTGARSAAGVVTLFARGVSVARRPHDQRRDDRAARFLPPGHTPQTALACFGEAGSACRAYCGAGADRWVSMANGAQLSPGRGWSYRTGRRRRRGEPSVTARRHRAESSVTACLPMTRRVNSVT